MEVILCEEDKKEILRCNKSIVFLLFDIIFVWVIKVVDKYFVWNFNKKIIDIINEDCFELIRKLKK